LPNHTKTIDLNKQEINKMKEINKKKHKKIGNVLGHYLCIGFSPMIQQ
jgi:hypothetical protein